MRTQATITALSLLTLTGCYGALFPEATGPTGDPFARPLPATTQLEELDATAASQSLEDQTGVPADLLLALAWVGSSFAPVEHDGEHCAPTHGWLGLNDAQIARAAELLGVPTSQVATDRETNLVAGAVLLAELRAQVAPGATDGEADATWWPVVVAWPALGEDWLNHEFAFDVFATLQRGLVATTSDGDIVQMLARDIPGLEDVEFIAPPGGDGSSYAAGTDYPGAARFTAAHSGNYSARSGGTSAIARVIIHTTEGSYDGAISWFRNPSSNVSAHYVIRRSDGQITQMVRDRDRAWHAAGANADTIGLEHEGAAASSATWTTAMLESSARLTAWITAQYDIPVSRANIKAHSEVTSYKSDPGPHFPWDTYIQLVNCYRFGGSMCAGDPMADLPGPTEGGGATDGSGTPGGAGGGADAGSGGATGGGSEGGATDGSTTGSATVEFVAPRDGDVVINPVTLWAKHDGGAHHLEFWSGPWRLGTDVMENPGNRAIQFTALGEKELTVRSRSSWGSTLATDSISVRVQRADVPVEARGQALGGRTWRIWANVGGDGAAFVRFYVDGYALTDDETGAQRIGAPHSMTYTFNVLGDDRVLVARAFDDDEHLLGEGTTLISVREDSASECGIKGTITCGQSQSGNTATDPLATSAHGGYPDIVGNWEGPELGYRWTASTSGPVEIRFVDPESTQLDLDIIVLASNYGTCVSADATGEVAWTSLEFEAVAGTEYVFVVDGYDGASGAFTIELDCDP